MEKKELLKKKKRVKPAPLIAGVLALAFLTTSISAVDVKNNIDITTGTQVEQIMENLGADATYISTRNATKQVKENSNVNYNQISRMVPNKGETIKVYIETSNFNKQEIEIIKQTINHLGNILSFSSNYKFEIVEEKTLEHILSKNIITISTFKEKNVLGVARYPKERMIDGMLRNVNPTVLLQMDNIRNKGLNYLESTCLHEMLHAVMDLGDAYANPNSSDYSIMGTTGSIGRGAYLYENDIKAIVALTIAVENEETCVKDVIKNIGEIIANNEKFTFENVLLNNKENNETLCKRAQEVYLQVLNYVQNNLNGEKYYEKEKIEQAENALEKYSLSSILKNQYGIDEICAQKLPVEMSEPIYLKSLTKNADGNFAISKIDKNFCRYYSLNDKNQLELKKDSISIFENKLIKDDNKVLVQYGNYFVWYKANQSSEMEVFEICSKGEFAEIYNEYKQQTKDLNNFFVNAFDKSKESFIEK